MAEIIGAFVWITIFGGIITLIGMKMRYSQMEDTRVSGGAQQEVEHLADAVDNLHAELGLLRDESVEFNDAWILPSAY